MITLQHPWHRHPLVPSNVDNGWACDGRTRLGGCLGGITGFRQTAGIPRWRCATCDFDLCAACISAKTPTVLTHLAHPHPLERNLDSGWNCDGRHLPGGCRRGITHYSQTIGVPRWRCQKCDYDLCDKCIYPFSQVPAPPAAAVGPPIQMIQPAVALVQSQPKSPPPMQQQISLPPAHQRNLTASSPLSSSKKSTLEDLLECPICNIMMGPPILQCHNGHSICSTCHNKVSSCPICRCDLNRNAPIRSLPLEHLIEIQDIKYPCAYETSGCTVLSSWGSQKQAHESQCSHRRVRCPHSIFVNNCSAMLKLEDIPSHCATAHGSQRREGPSVRLRIKHSSNKTSKWPLSILNDNLVIISSGLDFDFMVFARHLRGEPIRYRVSVSGNGFESAYSGLSEPLDQAPDFEIARSKMLAIHSKMIPNILEAGEDAVKMYVTVEILS